MQIPPLSVLESWPAPNYIDPARRGYGNLIINVVLFPLAITFLLLRIYTRLRITKSFGLDDVFILLAAIPTTAFFALTLVVDLYYNLFRHTWDITLPDLTRQLQINIGAECTFALAFTLTKLSILQLVWRILERSTSRSRIILLVSMGLVAVEGFVFCLTVILQCSPVSAYWTLSLTPQNCISQQANLLVGGTLNILTDVLVIVLPIVLIYNLNLPARQNILISSLFALGFIVVIASIARTIMFYVEGEVYDKTWTAYWVWLTSAIELYTGVLCASIPPTQPLFLKLFPKAFSHLYSSSSKQSSPSTATRTQPSGNNTAPPQQLPLSESALSIQKQIKKGSNIRGSYITVEDEVLISYEHYKSSNYRATSERNLDLEGGLLDVSRLSPLKTSGERSQNHVRPGFDYNFGMEGPKKESTSKCIKYLKAPQPKLVRIDLDNQRIKTITPESDWNHSNDGGSGRGSITSVTASPPPKTKSRHQREDSDHSKKNSKSDRSAGERWPARKESTSSALSGGSRVVGISIDPNPTIPLPSLPRRLDLSRVTTLQGSGTNTPTFNRDFSNEATENLNRFNRSRLSPATIRQFPSIPSPMTFPSARSLESLRSVPSTSGTFGPTTDSSSIPPVPVRNHGSSKSEHKAKSVKPDRPTENFSRKPSNTSSRPPTTSHSATTPLFINEFRHISGLMSPPIRSGGPSLDPSVMSRSISEEKVDSLRTSEIPSLSDFHWVTLMKTRDSTTRSMSMTSDGKKANRDSFVLGHTGQYPQPAGHKRQESRNRSRSRSGSRPRVDSQTLSLDTHTAEVLRSLRKGYA